MWGVLFLPDPCNQENNWDLLIMSPYLLWMAWNPTSGALRRALRWINMWFRIWHGEDCNWGILFLIVLFKYYWQWQHQQKLDQRSISPPWKNFSLIQMLLWRSPSIIWRISKSGDIWRIILKISVIQYYYIPSALKMTDNFSLSTLDLLLTSLRLLPIIGFVSGIFRDIQRFLRLLKNFMSVMRI